MLWKNRKSDIEKIQIEFLEDKYPEFALPIAIRSGPFKNVVFSFTIIRPLQNKKIEYDIVIHENEGNENELKRNKEFQKTVMQILSAVMMQSTPINKETYEEADQSDRIIDLEESDPE